jgi:hypothetical protein
MKFNTITEKMPMAIITIIHGDIQNTLDGKKRAPSIPGNTTARTSVTLKDNELGMDIKPGDTGSQKECGLLPDIKTDGVPAIKTNIDAGSEGGINSQWFKKDIGKKDRCGPGVIDESYLCSLIFFPRALHQRNDQSHFILTGCATVAHPTKNL